MFTCALPSCYIGKIFSCNCSLFHATSTRSFLALANYFRATSTGPSLALANMEKIKKGLYFVTAGEKAYRSLSKTYQLKHEEEVNHAAGAFVRLKRRGPDPAWSVCTHVVSIARGRKSKISFHRPFIPERKARSLKVNKPQQGLRAASDCQPTDKIIADVRVNSAGDWQRVPKNVVQRDFSKNHADFGKNVSLKITIFANRARDCDFQCWIYFPVNSSHQCLIYVHITFPHMFPFDSSENGHNLVRFAAQFPGRCGRNRR